MNYALSILSILTLIAVGYVIYAKYILPNIEEEKRKATTEGFNPFDLIIGLFKLVPILIQVFSRLDKVFDAFLNASQGLIFAIINTVIASSFMFVDSFRFSFALAKYLFKSIVCSLENIGNLQYCIWFYAFDMFLLVIKVIFFSFLELIDTQFDLEGRTGFSLVKTVEWLGELMESADAETYNQTGVHIMGYPDAVISLCYKCSNPPDKNELLRNTMPIKEDVFIKLPPLISEPVSYFVNAGMDLADVFSGF